MSISAVLAAAAATAAYAISASAITCMSDLHVLLPTTLLMPLPTSQLLLLQIKLCHQRQCKYEIHYLCCHHGCLPLLACLLLSNFHQCHHGCHCYCRQLQLLLPSPAHCWCCYRYCLLIALVNYCCHFCCQLYCYRDACLSNPASSFARLSSAVVLLEQGHQQLFLKLHNTAYNQNLKNENNNNNHQQQ